MSDSLSIRVLPDGPEQIFDGRRPVIIGRDPDSDVVVAQERVSRHHAVVRFDGRGHWILEDQSTNGVFANGARITTVALTSALTIRLGKSPTAAELRLGLVEGSQPKPRVDKGPELGTLSTIYDPSKLVRIGRSHDNDIVVPDLLVSRHHAELRGTHRGGYEIVDLASNNGTFIDGARIKRRAALENGVIISLGHHLFRLWEGKLEEYVDSGDVSFAALDLVVRAGSRVLLDDVSFVLEASQFVAVLGPTGAGKSTLLKALIGSRPADQGQVLYNGRDLYTSYAELRNRIGFVPQDDLLHQQLTVRAALEYAAQLRFPPDVASKERRHRVEEVMSELGLTDRADLVVSKLSGGQRKRTSVAIELLTLPSLLVLDEPTSGLDPGYEKSVMEILRKLADGGRTVITVTHSVQSLESCDRILFLAPGGGTAYFGPPAEMLPFFRFDEYAEVFQALDRSPEGAKAEYAGSDEYNRYVKAPVAGQRARAPHRGAGEADTPPPKANWWHQFSALTRRYVSVIIGDRRNTLLLVLQAPVLGILMYAALGRNNLRLTKYPSLHGSAGTVLVALILAATYLGASNSIREIVKERGILTRELVVGVSPSAYVLSKAVVLGGLTMVQAVILLGLGDARQGGPVSGSVFASGRLELLVVVALTGLAAMALGLFVSSLVSNADKGLSVLPVILFAQFLLSGSVFSLARTPVLNQLSYLTSSRWGYASAASTASLKSLQGCPGSDTGGVPSLPPGSCSRFFDHSAGTWELDMAALVVLTLLAFTGTWRVVRSLAKPGRR